MRLPPANSEYRIAWWMVDGRVLAGGKNEFNARFTSAVLLLTKLSKSKEGRLFPVAVFAGLTPLIIPRILRHRLYKGKVHLAVLSDFGRFGAFGPTLSDMGAKFAEVADKGLNDLGRPTRSHISRS